MKSYFEVVVNKAIEDRKIRPDQKAWALEYTERDPASFVVFLSKVTPIPAVPERLLTESPANEIDEVQAMINSLCGIDEETFKEFSPGAGKGKKKDPLQGEIDETQRMINKLCGIDDETFRKYKR